MHAPTPHGRMCTPEIRDEVMSINLKTACVVEDRPYFQVQDASTLSGCGCAAQDTLHSQRRW